MLAYDQSAVNSFRPGEMSSTAMRRNELGLEEATGGAAFRNPERAKTAPPFIGCHEGRLSESIQQFLSIVNDCLFQPMRDVSKVTFCHLSEVGEIELIKLRDFYLPNRTPEQIIDDYGHLEGDHLRLVQELKSNLLKLRQSTDIKEQTAIKKVIQSKVLALRQDLRCEIAFATVDDKAGFLVEGTNIIIREQFVKDIARQGRLEINHKPVELNLTDNGSEAGQLELAKVFFMQLDQFLKSTDRRMQADVLSRLVANIAASFEQTFDSPLLEHALKLFAKKDGVHVCQDSENDGRFMSIVEDENIGIVFTRMINFQQYDQNLEPLKTISATRKFTFSKLSGRLQGVAHEFKDENGKMLDGGFEDVESDDDLADSECQLTTRDKLFRSFRSAWSSLGRH